MNIRCLLSICVFVYAAVALPPEAPAQADGDAAAMTVTLTRVRQGALQATLHVHGMVVPRNDIAVSTDIAAVQIIELCAEEGDRVTKGQVLARLDTASLQYTLDSLGADLVKAEGEFKRAQAIEGTGAVSIDEAAQRKSRYFMLKAQVADARLRLHRAVIRSPVDGIVYQRVATTGAMTQTDQPLFRIAAGGTVEFEVFVPEAHAYAITPETPAEAALAGSADYQPTAIRVLSPRILPATRTANVRLSQSRPAFIPVGTFCTARFRLPAREGLIVLTTTLQQDVQGSFVWAVQDDNSVTRRTVQVLARNGSEALVEGLSENQPLVARAGAFLQEGDRIRPVNRAEGGAERGAGQ